MNNRGFTLIELLITIAIIGILSAVAVTGYIGAVKKAARSEAYANLQSLRLLEEQVFAENAVYFPDPTAPRSHANPTTGAANIRAIMPGFQPGGNPAALPDFGLSYTYGITQNFQLTNITGNTTATPPTTAASVNACFVATATGVPGTRVCPDAANCDMFALDCNNNRNF